MNTVYNAVAGVANVAKETIVGKDDGKEQTDNSGTEPVAGKKGDAKDGKGPQPFDQGNLETPLGSPIATDPAAGTAPSTAAHTDPNPTKPAVTDTSAAAAIPLPASTETAKETNADTSGPKVGNATLVPNGDATQAKTETPAATAANTITTPAQAEAEIKKDAKAAEPDIKTDSKTGTASATAGEKKTGAGNISEPVSPKTKDFSSAAKTSSSATDSPSASTKTKKRFSTMLKEKLHIGSKKDKPSSS